MTTQQVLIETYWNVKISIKIRKNIAKTVLIETYWNVKTVQNNPTLNYIRINRNILECKVKSAVRLIFHTCRINRNILECKDALRSSGACCDPCINRNILECKDKITQGEDTRDGSVLIETYWNVKKDFFNFLSSLYEY